MKNKKILLILIIILIILGFFYFTKYDKNNSEVIILNDNQDGTKHLETYSNEKYGFIFSYPQDWNAKAENSELIQLYNYSKIGDQTLSENVLNKYEKEKAVILAVVDKENMKVIKIFEANPHEVVKKLKEKLGDKAERYAQKGGLRRLQVSLSRGDLEDINASEISFS